MPTDPNRISALAARWMILGEWRAHPGRVVVAALAIAIGVALGFAVHLINASALNEFARAVQTVNGDADLQVRAATPAGFDEALYPQIARAQGIAAASPVVELPAKAGGTNAALTLLGLDILRAGLVTPRLTGRRNTIIDAGSDDIFDGDALFLSAGALRAAAKRVGDGIVLTAGGRDVSFVIAGTLPGVADGQNIGVIDIAAAQWRFGQLGRLQRIDLRLADGADPERTKRALAAILPANAQIASPQTQAQRSDSLSRAYRVNLDMLALMALLSGAFLVFSAQALSVARRRAQFALLRVLGVRRRALLAQVLVEGAVVGSTGAVLGLALGLGLAYGALRILGGDLGGGYFQGARPQLIFAPEAALVFLSLGILAALIGSALPARDAANAQPAIALKDVGDAIDPNAAPGAWPALALLIAGTATAFLPAIAGLPVFGYLSVGLLLAGGVCAMPLLARLLLAPLQRFASRNPAIDLALKRLWGAPSQAAIALCGIVASTSLMVAMAVMVTSFRGSVDDWLLQILPADVYLRVDAGESAGFDAGLQQRLRATHGVAAMHFLKAVPLTLSPEQPPVALVAQTIDRADPAKTLPLLGASRTVPAGVVPVWVSEPASWLYGWRAGDRIALPLSGARGGADRFFVAGIYRDYARQGGAVAMDDADYSRLTGDTMRTDASVVLAPGARANAVIDALRARLPATLRNRVTIAEPRDIRARALQVFDRSFAVTYLLEAIAILVGLAGVAASFSAQTLARTKEFGMLRHVGVLRGQIVAMLAAEGALLGTVGVIAGIGLGLAISQVLIHVVNPQSFHWTMQTRLPLRLFAGVTLSLIAAASGTALLAGRRALSADAVRAVREDW